MKSLILADQTGVGKGRVVASVIRWALLHGHKAIFMTYKDTLWFDMIRDLDDIDFLNNKLCTIYNTKKMNIEYNGKNICKRDKRYSGQNIIFTTYTQIQGKKIRSEDDQKELIFDISQNAILILDEAHEAASSIGNLDNFRGIKPKVSNRFLFIYSLYSRIRGVLYSSATYAKRPDNLMLYYPFTEMSDSFSYDNLLEVLKETSIVGQSILSNALVESGQLIRRESSFEGVIINDKYTNDILKNDEIRINQNWDIYSEIMQAILQFDKLVKPIVLGYIKAGEMQSDEFSKIGNVDSLKIEQSNFSSRLHNLIALLDLSLKAKATVEYVTRLIDKGEKVIIVLSNTAGSLINSEYPVGTKVDTTLKAIFKKSLYSTLSYTVTKWKNPAVKHTISVEMLKESFPEVYRFFSAIENLIDNIKTDDPLSTIDYITYHLEKRNIPVMEITGRNTFIDYNNKFINTNRKKERTESISQKFNNSTEYNCIILNSSGSTGISLHASEKFKDKRKRHMVLIQPSLDINVVMQSLGRIHRTGQVVLPEYTFLNLPIPVAYRLQIVLRKKLSSLNANTKGSSGKNEGTLKNVEDMANFIGDQCVFQYLLANPEINTLLDDPLKLNSDSPTTYKAFLKTSGRLAILKIEEQEEFYDKIFDDYKGKLADFEAQGISLDNQPIDLQAKTINKNTMFPGDPEGKILQRPAIVETVQVKTEKIDIKSEYQKLNIDSEQDIIKQSKELLDSYRFRKEEARKAKNERRQTKNN